MRILQRPGRPERPGRFRRPGKAVVLLVLGVLLVAAAGCSRTHYRLAADNEVYGLIDERQSDPRWILPRTNVTADPRSRLADPTDRDCGPLPPDDPAAHRWMHYPYKFRGWRGWGRHGCLRGIEFPEWLEHLPRDTDGNVELERSTSMQLALLNSRTYQDQLEQLYLTALALSLQRFEFDVRWFAGTGLFYDVFGKGDFPDGSETLRLDNRAGLTRNLASGGQLLVDFANSFVWEFAGGQVSLASSSLLLSLTQPLLRSALREVRLEDLTQAERDLLYEVRAFTRFRREFYVDVVGRNGYLGLLGLAQAIRNQLSNLESLERNYEEHQALAMFGLVAQIQVDEVYQELQQGRLDLMAAQQGLQEALDQFKLQLGLPPELEVQLDEEALDPFELNDPRLSELGDRNEELRLSLLQYDLDGPPPPADVIVQGYSELTALQAAMGPHLKDVAAELRRWQDRLPDPKEGPDAAGPTTEDLAMQQQLVTRLAETLQETHEDFTQDQADTVQAVEQLTQTPRNQAWEQLHELVGTAFRRTLADLFVIQTQIRVYRLEIEALQVSQENALRTAWQNRLDLMNARGNVIDGFRRVEVAADGLQGDLDFTLEAELATDPGRSNPLRFDSSASRYRAGVAFDSPLNRLAERNTYRAAQLAYQRARRQFMAVEDSIALDIRRDLRALAFSRFQFETTRQQVITAARQVEEAQFNLRSTQEPNSSLTRDLLVALQRLLNAKNSMILSWVNYETSRMNLARDLGIMQIDGDGTWTNEHDTSFQTGEATEEEARGDTREQAGARGHGSAPADGAELIPAQPADAGNVESLPPPQ